MISRCRFGLTRRYVCFVMLAHAAAALAPAASLWGQDPNPPPAFNGAGKVVEVGEGAIRMVNDKADEFLVQMDQTTTVTLFGAIEESFLTSGTLVRFSVDLDDRGLPTGEVKALTVVEPSASVQPGVFRDGGPNDVATEKGKKRTSLAGLYVVVGQVKSCKKGNLQVQPPGAKPIKTKLAADAKLEIDVAAYWLAQPDDEIVVEGSLLQEGRLVKGKPRPGIVKAVKVELKPAQPLTNHSKKKGKGKKQSQSKEKGGKKKRGKDRGTKDKDQPGDKATAPEGKGAAPPLGSAPK